MIKRKGLLIALLMVIPLMICTKIIANDSNEYVSLDSDLIELNDYYENEIEVKGESISQNVSVKYSANIQGEGWQNWNNNGQTAGTTGKGLRLEGIKIQLQGASDGAEIVYQGHVQDIGWQDWKTEGQVAGTEGQSKRIEAIRIKIKNQDEYSIKYRVHVENIGWQDWKKDGQLAGTTGQALRIEAIEIAIEKKTAVATIKATGQIENEYYNNDKLKDEGIYYTNLENSTIHSYIDDVDYSGFITAQELNSTTDQISKGNGFNIYSFSFNLESINSISDGNHIIHYVVVDKNGTKIAALDRKNIFVNKNDMQVVYEAHVENIGWQDKKKNGEMAGTTGQALRVEALKVSIVNAPMGAGIICQAHVENIGWQDWKSNGQISGTEGKALRVEALRIKLQNLDEYSIKYRVHVENIGWQSWKCDGQLAGTTGQALRIEAIEIMLEPKKAVGKILLNSSEEKTYYANETIIEEGSYYTNLDCGQLMVWLDNVDYTENLIINKVNSINRELSIGNGFNTYDYSLKKSIDNLEDGEHTIIFILLDDNGNTVDSARKQLIIDKANPHIFYKTCMKNKGWSTNISIDGETSGGIAIEGINIYTKNLSKGVTILYQAHVANIGWMNWTNEGQDAGVPGSSNGIEALRIKLNNDDNYTIKYRAYVIGVGWQNWKYDGEMAGSTGLGKSIQSIEIVLTPKEVRSISGFDLANQTIFYEDIDLTGYYLTNKPNMKLDISIDGESVNNAVSLAQSSTIYDEHEGYGDATNTSYPLYSIHLNREYIRMLGNGEHIVRISIKDGENEIYSNEYKLIVDLRNIHIKYSVDGNNYFRDDGTAEINQSITKFKAYLVNNDESINLEYKLYFSDSGWENIWHKDNELSNNNNKSIQAIRFRIESDEYSIQYKVKIDNKWEDEYSYDGEYAGVVNQNKTITGIKVRIVPKITEKKAKLVIDFPNGKLKRGEYTFYGWGITNDASARLKVYLDGNSIDITRVNRVDVLNIIKGYRGDVVTPQPGFEFAADLRNAKHGKHTVKAEYITSNGLIINSTSFEFEITKANTIETGKYGVSGLKNKGEAGYDLEYYRFGDGPNVAFFTFEVHGFEDHWDRDGTELVLTAMNFFERLKADNDYELGEKWTIYIFPECNPDGRNKGYTNDGPGRTTLYSIYGDVGVDMNRCWSTDFEPKYNARNYTGQFSFASYEAQYLKEFLLSHKSTKGQTILVDCHGWLSQLIGDKDLMGYYNSEFPGSKLTYTYGKGYLINWARANLGANGITAKSILVELPNTVTSPKDFVNQNVANRFVNASINMLKGI